MAEPSNGNGNSVRITTKDYIDRLGEDLKDRFTDLKTQISTMDGKIEGLALTLHNKADRSDVRALDEKISRIDVEGSHGLREATKELEEHKVLLNSLISWRNRQYGMYVLIVFLLPIAFAIAWHTWL